MTALLVTSKDADRRLLQHLCIAPVRLFEESIMESAVACWEWLLAARSDLRAQVLSVASMIFVNENENENGEKRENNEFVNEN